MLLFCIPLYRLEDLRRIFPSSFFNKGHTFETFLSKLFLIFVTYIISVIFLALYTQILSMGYRKFIKKSLNISLKTTRKQNIMDLIKEKHTFFIFAFLIYFSYVFIFYFAVKHVNLVCLIFGLSIHAFLLMFTNKILVKKYW